MELEFSDYEFQDMLDELIDAGRLEVGTPEYGIAQRVLHDGSDSLTPKQSYIYNTKVAPHLMAPAKRREIQRILDSNPD